MRGFAPSVAFLLLCLPLAGATIHPSHRKYHNEVVGILKQYGREVRAYESKHPDDISNGEVAMYSLRANTDTYLVLLELGQYDKHAIPQEEVDAALNQLSRDVEDTPHSYN